MDTNHCSKLLNRDPDFFKKITTIGLSNCGTCTIVAGELFYMVEHSKFKLENRKAVEALLPTLQVFPVDRRCAEAYGRLKEKLYLHYVGKKGLLKRIKLKLGQIGISENDLWIAATAISNSCAVVSRDGDFERIRAVEAFPLESWYK